MTDVRRLMKLQEDRDSVMSLSRTGALSEETLAAFRKAEKDLELELYEVQAEAETFKTGWSQEIVQDAVRLSRVEDEILEVKKRKEREEKKREEEALQKEKEKIRAERSEKLDEEEKKKLLEELLEDERMSPSSITTKGTAKKRSSAGGKK